MTVSCVGSGRVRSKFFSLVVNGVGLGRVTQNEPMDNSATAPQTLCRFAPAIRRPYDRHTAR